MNREGDEFPPVPLSSLCFTAAVCRPLTYARSNWLWGRPSCWPGQSGAWRRPSWPTWRAPVFDRPSQSPSRTRLFSPRWPAGQTHFIKLRHAKNNNKKEKADSEEIWEKPPRMWTIHWVSINCWLRIKLVNIFKLKKTFYCRYCDGHNLSTMTH